MFGSKLDVLIATAVLSTASAVPAAAPDPQIGVYYFPGWDGSEAGSWKAISAYPDRKPRLGWYRDGDPAILAEQLQWMARYGIDYVAFDWYWENGGVHADQAVKAYLDVPQSKVDFALLWANDKPGITIPEWRKIVTVWLERYLKSPKYLKVGGKPVVFVLTYQGFAQTALDTKTTPKAYVDIAQRMARDAGLPGIYLVANFDDLSTTLITDDAVKAGFSAVSAYNLHRKPWRPQEPDWFRLTRGYAQLDQAYRENWKEALRSTLPVVVPMTAGWDRRPWGGSADPLHDKSVATAPQFAAHLTAAKKMMGTPGKHNSGLGVICCWNEFGEGSFIEPTEQQQFSQLKQVRKVFPPGGSSRR